MAASTGSNKEQPLASQARQLDYASVGPAQALVGRLRSVGIDRFWVAFYLMAVSSSAVQGLGAQLVPEIAASYYNGWRGDPCRGWGAANPACRSATSKFVSTSSTVGFVLSFWTLLSTPVVGRLADSVGRWPLLLGSCLLGMVQMMSVLGLAAHLVPIQVYYASYMIGNALPSMMIFFLFVTDRTDVHTRVFYMSVLLGLVDTEGILLNMLGSVLDARGCMVIMVSLYVLVIYPALFALPESLPPQSRKAVTHGGIFPSLGQVLSPLADPGFRCILLFQSTYWICFHYLNANYQVYIMEMLGCSRAEFLRLRMASAIIGTFAQVFLAGPISRLVGFRNLFAAGFASGAVGFVLLANAKGRFLVVLASCFGGFHAVLAPATFAVLSNMVSAARRGEVTGYLATLQTVAVALVVFALSQLHAACSASSAGVPFLVISALNAVSLVVVLTSWGHIERAQAQAEKEDAASSEPKEFVA